MRKDKGGIKMENIDVDEEWKKVNKVLMRSCITKATLFSVDPWSKTRMKLKFLLKNYGVWTTTFPKTFVEKYQLKEKVDKIIQVYYTVDKDNNICAVIPTFFDSKQRCKKCGRFYKLYCKYCYERFKDIRTIKENI